MGRPIARPTLAASVLATLIVLALPANATAVGPAPPPASPTCVSPIASWSLSQRLEQLIMVSGQFSNLAASASPASSGVGAFVFFGQPAAGSGPAIQSGIAALVNDARGAGQIIPWMSTDEEGGYVARLSNVIGALPTPRQMASIWTTWQVQTNMRMHGAAMRALGISMDLAPVADTASATNTIADENDRSFSEHGDVAGAYSVAYANGLRSANVVPVLKHFPGFGHANANTDLGPATDPSLDQLQFNDIPPFEQGIANWEPVIMVGHPIVPGLTAGLPASLSPATYQYLRNTLHFNGVALTDSLNAGAISAAGYSQPSASVAAIAAGVDMVLIDVSAWPATLSALESAVSSGAIPTSVVNNDVAAILNAKGLRICRSATIPPPVPKRPT